MLWSLIRIRCLSAKLETVVGAGDRLANIFLLGGGTVSHCLVGVGTDVITAVGVDVVHGLGVSIGAGFDIGFGFDLNCLPG
jgi:acetyltransferase-like isoleucine patch superfamily enzyme